MRKILSTIALVIILSMNIMTLSALGSKHKTKNSDTTQTKTIQKTSNKKVNNDEIKTSTKKVNNNEIKTSTKKPTKEAAVKKATKKVNKNGIKTPTKKPSKKATTKNATRSYKTKSIGRVNRIKTIVRGRTIIQPFGIVHYVHNFNVRIWTNRGEYYDGDRIKVYVKSNRSCYIVVYDIDTYGNVNIIYPEYGSGYLRANRRKRIDRWWYVEGPSGYEELVVVASRHPFDAYEYGGYLRMELGRGRSIFRTVPRHYRRIAVSSTNFFVNSYHYYNDYDYGYYDYGDYYDDYYYGSGYNGYYGYGVVIINAPVRWGVYIDGTFYGRGRRRIKKMKPGWHNVMVKENGKIKYKERVYVKKDKEYKINMKNR